MRGNMMMIMVVEEFGEEENGFRSLGRFILLGIDLEIVSPCCSLR